MGSWDDCRVGGRVGRVLQGLSMSSIQRSDHWFRHSSVESVRLWRESVSLERRITV